MAVSEGTKLRFRLLLLVECANLRSEGEELVGSKYCCTFVSPNREEVTTQVAFSTWDTQGIESLAQLV